MQHHSGSAMRQQPGSSAPQPSTLGPLPAQAAMPGRGLDLREPIYLNPGPTNRIVLSLKSGLPSHISWGLSRLTLASMHQPEALLLEMYPGLIEALLSFPFRLASAVTGGPPEAWEPMYWEQKERDVDGVARAGVPDDQHLQLDEDGFSDASTDDSDAEGELNARASSKASQPLAKNRASTSTYRDVRFDPLRSKSHSRLLENAVSATLILRNASLNERNERMFMVFSRTVNTLVRDLLALPTSIPTARMPNEYSELEGIEELRVYALDILEVTRVRLSIKKSITMRFDASGDPLPPPMQVHALDNDRQNDIVSDASKRNLSNTAEHIFILLVWHLHTTQDRSVLIGALRCLGALAGEERNQRAFIERDVRISTSKSSGQLVSSPGILRKCLSLLPLTQDSALLEATLDCMYQVVNIGDNALRLGVTSSDLGSGPTPLRVGIAHHSCASQDAGAAQAGLDDVRSVTKLLARLLTYGRVVWDRTHQLNLHPALHMGIPSAMEMRRREYAILQSKRRRVEGDDRVRAKTRKLQRSEWMQLKDMPEPERLKAWLRVIYESKEHAEVSQMEFWTTYSSQFGPYSQLGGPPLQPAAEVIRTVSSVFPGAVAMVMPNQKFVVRGVEARDRSFIRRLDCQWRGCTAPETESHVALEGHVRRHVAATTNNACAWDSCTFKTPDDARDGVERLESHVATHLPETDEQVSARLNRESGTSLPSFPGSNGAQNGARNVPTPERNERAEARLIEYEKVEAQRRARLNMPTRGTVDWPDVLPFCVTRTPMDPASARPVGIAATASLILRTLARTSDSILAKVRARRRAAANAGDDAMQPAGHGEKGIQTDAMSDRFGLPIPSMPVPEAEGDADHVSGDSAAYTRDGIAGSASEQQSEAAWTESAAANILDALLDCEYDMMRVASENDILCPALNDALGAMSAERGASLLGDDAASCMAANVLVAP